MGSARSFAASRRSRAPPARLPSHLPGTDTSVSNPSHNRRRRAPQSCTKAAGAGAYLAALQYNNLHSEHPVKLNIGYSLGYQCSQPTPMILNLNVHHTRAGDLIRADLLTTDPWVPLATYHDGFGNLCTRLVAP